MFFIFIANNVALQFYWYYSIWWFDIVMHFLGGFWEGLFFIWFFSIKDLPLLKSPLNLNDPKLAFKTILFVLLIGVLYEVFEFFVHNNIGRDPFDVLDTVLDIFFDLSGGAFTVWYFFKRIMSVKENTL